MGDDIPQWAKERAEKLANAEHSLADMGNATLLAHACYIAAFARYIAEHEEAPVDPLRARIENIAVFGAALTQIRDVLLEMHDEIFTHSGQADA
jgi:hypothetical protein